jgi:hypothetical protein
MRMKKVKIEDVEYVIMPVPPYLSPYSTKIGELMRKQPCDMKDADRISSEINEFMKKLLADTVSPEPKKEHMLQVFSEVTALTNKVMEDAGLFRGPRGSGVEKSGESGPSIAREAEQDSES